MEGTRLVSQIFNNWVYGCYSYTLLQQHIPHHIQWLIIPINTESAFLAAAA
jgi:hypothetical protein